MKEGTLGGCYSIEDRKRIEKLGVRLIPPDPTNLVESVTVPPPTYLDPKMTDVEQVKFLALVYRESGHWRYKQDVWAYTSGKPTKWKGYDKLVESARLLARVDVPPAAWCMWSFDVWNEYLGVEGLPAPIWVWSASRIRSNMAWFKDQVQLYLDSRQILAPTHRDLIDDWAAMWVGLLAAKPVDRIQVTALVDYHFPEDTYETRLKAAQAGSCQLQRKVMADNEKGMVCW